MKLRTIFLATAALFAIPAAVTHADDGLRLVALTASRVTTALGYTPANPGAANTWTGTQTFGNTFANSFNGTGTTSSLLLSSENAATTGAYLQLFGSGSGNPGLVVFGSGGANRAFLGTAGGFTVGGSLPTSALTGELDLNKITASGTAPGAGNLKLSVVAGTNSGTCKLIAYAGTSTTPVTVADNIGAGC